MSGKKYTVISTFAGCGGSSLGYKMAGFKELLAVEIDKIAADTFKKNFKDVYVYNDDIRKLTSQQVMKITKLKKYELDCFDGSPPCQGFSVAGKRIVNDERNYLYKDYLRLVNELKPKTFVFENVPGLAIGKMKNILRAIIKEMYEIGYNVKAEILNAKYYNVPQNRKRLIIIGVRNDIKIKPSLPKPQSKPIPMIEAIKGADTKGTPKLSPYYAKLYDHIPVNGSCRTLLNKGNQTCVKPNPLKPCNTLTKLQNGSGFATIVHPWEARPLSVGEAKRISSFPDEFILLGNYQQQMGMLGNCVPPLLMKAIAEHIKTNILDVYYGNKK